jgi:DNA-binding HxlR family transcriptional regulator
MARMAEMASPDPSPLADALRRVGDRWTLLIVQALLSGPRRFNELSAELEGIAANVLSQRLRHLEHEGLVLARPYSQRPPRLEYQLTGGGAELAGALRMLAQWGARGPGAGDLPRHAACGSPLEARWYCPTCARVVDDHNDPELRFL